VGVCAISGTCETKTEAGSTYAFDFSAWYQPIFERANTVTAWASQKLSEARIQKQEGTGAPYFSIALPFGRADSKKKSEQEIVAGEKNATFIEFLCGSNDTHSFLQRVIPFFAGSDWCKGEEETELVHDNSTDLSSKRKVTEEQVVEERVKPDLYIVADPATVRLEGRTFIRWATKNVTEGSCTVSGPGFKHTEDWGSGSTIALSEPATFTLLCEDIYGAAVFKSVTVDIGL